MNEPSPDGRVAEATRKEWRIGRILLAVTLPLYLLDQWTKFWTIGRFAEPDLMSNPFATPDPPVTVIEGYFYFTRVHNQGVAFGFGNGSDWAPVVFLIVPLVALALITLGLKKDFFVGKWGMVSVGLLLAGILGNLTDRLVQGSLLSHMEGAPLWERLKAGYVVDFIDITIPLVNYRWPCFNVADSCICVAAVLMFFTGLKADLQKPGQ
jgi:signal peptidase II